MKIFNYLVICIIFTVPLQVYPQQMELEVISLQYRLANDIIPVIRPILSPGGSVTGINEQLIIKTTPANLLEIKTILSRIDKSPRRLMIYVNQDIDGHRSKKEQSLTGNLSTGDVTFSGTKQGHSDRGLSITAADEKGNNARYSDVRTHNTVDDNNTFSIQALEGEPAFIQSGQSVPFTSQSTHISPHGVVVHEATEFRDITSGFYVLPRLSGDRVTLLIAPSLSRFNHKHGGIHEIQGAETTIYGRLGEWIDIGGITSEFNGANNRNLSHGRVQQQENRTIQLMVREIN